MSLVRMYQKYNLVILFIYVVNNIGGQEAPTIMPPKISRECVKKGICQIAHDYPTDLAKKLIQELKDRNTIITDDPVIKIKKDSRLFHKKRKNEKKRPNACRNKNCHKHFNHSHHEHKYHNRLPIDKKKPKHHSFTSRFPVIEEKVIKLCESIVQYENPKMGQNGHNKWKYLLNDDENPFQTFRAERCKPNRTKCAKELIFLPNYKSRCIQNWILKEMYCIEEDGSLGKDYFKVPTCCSCKIVHRNK